MTPRSRNAGGTAPAATLQQAVVSLLRCEPPAPDFDPAEIDDCLTRYECGGYLHDRWSREGRISELPSVWAEALARSHHRTVVDNLVALAEFRAIATHLEEERIPFVVLKGASYLVDLYQDPGARMLTDIDLLIHRQDAGRIARRLLASGYRGEVGRHYPEDRRFEMWLPRQSGCRIEFHWRLGLPLRVRIEQDSIWRNAVPARLERIECRRPSAEDALLYHVGHLADHYFGPSLKWVIDLREMIRLWKPDPERLTSRAGDWRVRVALYLALCHVEKLFPGEVPDGLLAGLKPGAFRRRMLAQFTSDGPAEALAVDRPRTSRLALRPLLVDSPWDALALGVRVGLRPLVAALNRLMRRHLPPWEWAP